MTVSANFQVSELLPQSGKMVLLDRILSVDDNSLSAELRVRYDGLLLGDQQTVPSWAGIEYMAQAIAAFTGVKTKLAGEPIRLGFLLGARGYRSNVATFAVGAQLTVTVNKVFQDALLAVFECRIQGENIDIDARLNVYQPPPAIDQDHE
ncbi:MAG: 3-hydroxylacyl-ACP dehydratase [Methylomonas sp.]|jgi:predicted hotdog family 3-hydroxylacyl-ACP dehydratase